MARRNKATRVQRNAPAAGSGQTTRRSGPETPEDAAERKKFFLWTGIITAIVVLLIYFFLFA